jgi:hypothetical protein
MIEWRVIPGFENYEASNLGDIRNARTGKPISQWQYKTGYKGVTLYRDGKKHSSTVHKCITGAFFGPKPEGLIVNHKDEDRTNNNIDNLEYVTYTYNNNYGNRLQKVHDSNPNKIAIVAENIATGEIKKYDSIHSADRDLNISFKLISRVVSGERNYTHGYKFYKQGELY